MEEPARATWARLKSMDDGQVPLRLRLVCQSTVALVFERDGDVERLKELEKIARDAGLDAQAAVCRLKITDELLLGARYEKAAEMASAMLQAGEPMPRIRALIQHNLAHALVRLGRVAEAQAAAQATLRALPAYAHLVMDLFARVAAQEGRFEDAAVLAGCSAQIKRDRDLHPDASEIGMIEETRQQIEQTLGVDRVAALMRQGAAMAVEHVLRLAWRT
jgi:tetratricopeptide (TPR) repeat protein